MLLTNDGDDEDEEEEESNSLKSNIRNTNSTDTPRRHDSQTSQSNHFHSQDLFDASGELIDNDETRSSDSENDDDEDDHMLRDVSGIFTDETSDAAAYVPVRRPSMTG